MIVKEQAIRLGAEEVWRVAVGFNTYESAQEFFEYLTENAYVCHIRCEDNCKFDVWYR